MTRHPHYTESDSIVWSDIFRELGLKRSDACAEEVKNSICELVEILNRDSRIANARSKGLNRAGVNTQLRRLCTRLEDLDRFLARDDANFRQAANTLIAPELAYDLSNAAFERYLGGGLPFGTVTFRDLDDPRYERSEHLLYETMDQPYRRVRQGLADQKGLTVLRGHLRALGDRLQAHLDLQSASKGGRPANRHRVYVIANLAEMYFAATGNRATKTANGPFHRFCASVFAAIGMDTKGLEPAIGRVLGERAT